MHKIGSDPFFDPFFPYCFKFSYQSALGTEGKQSPAETTIIEDIWTTKGLDEPAVDIWLDVATRPSGDAETDKKISEMLSTVDGVPLKRTSLLAFKLGEKRELKTTINMEVKSVVKNEIPKSEFKAPF